MTTPASSDPDIRARFNINLGQANCLTGAPFYLGLDATKAPRSISWPSSSTSSGTAWASRRRPTARPARLFSGFPSAFDHFLFDQTQNLLWVDMTDAQRATSAINTRRLSWTGANVTANVPNVLSPGTPELTATAPASIANTYLIGIAAVRSAADRLRGSPAR